MGMKTWLEIFRFEVVYQLRRKSTWLFFGLFLIPLIGVTNARLLDPNREGLFNAPLAIAQSSVTISLAALLIVAAVAGDAATRDLQTRLEPLMQAAPISRAAYICGRFSGAFAMAAMLLAVVPLVHLLVPLLNTGVDPEVVGAFSPAVYLQSYFLVMVPNAFVATAFMFALATLMRHLAGSYTALALLFAGTQVTMELVARRLGHWDLAVLLDPTGVIAIELMARTWSPIHLSERLIGASPTLMWNRLFWVAICCAVLVFTARRFNFAGDAGAVRWWQRGRLRLAGGGSRGEPVRGDARREAGAVAPPVVRVEVPHAPRDFGAAARVRQTLAIARDSLRELRLVWPWLVLLVLVIKITGTLSALAGMGAGTMVLPTTDLVLAPVEDDAPPPLLLAIRMLPVILAGEVIWRERDANMHGLADAAPVPDGVRFVGKVLGLWLVFVALNALLMLAGVVVQLLRGWYDFDPALYFQILGLRMVKALVFALVALSVHVLVNQKYVAHFVTLAGVVASTGVAELLRIEHPLLILGYEPRWRHSPISGFEPFLGSVLWFQLYWAAWALLLALAARLFWVRGVERSVVERLRLARQRFRGRIAGAVVGASTVVLLVGGFVFYNTNILNAYEPTAAGPERQAEYERVYGRYRGTPQPRITSTDLSVDLYPDRREGEVRGVHLLANRTAHPIDTIHVATSAEVETGDIEFGRPARAAVLDVELSHRIYVLEDPLLPGDSLRMSWQVRHAPRGFPARGISTAVVGNGSFIAMADWMPLIGYQTARELSSAGERRGHGLPARPAVPSLENVRARSDRSGMDRIHLDVTVGTAVSQIALAPGELVNAWEQDGRRYFHYVTDAPIGNRYAIFSANYAVRRAQWENVVLEVVHHPEHDLNVDRMLRGMRASLEQFTERFGPYPYRVLRFVEHPGAGGSLHAAAGNVWYLELFSLMDPDHEPRRIDLPFAVVGHEVAHQFQPISANVEGESLLSESFAWYAALGVIEQQYGAEHLQRFLGFMRESYADPRSEADVPLLRASDFFLGYRKGLFAMYALQEYLGRDRVDLAWRRLRAQHASGEPPFATSLDLYRELQEVTPDSLHGLLGDLLERNTFWELRASGASAQQIATGEWKVTLDVEARKMVVDTAGVETDKPMGDLIEIGLYAPANGDGSSGRPLYLGMHRIRTGPQTITVTLPQRPARAGIDPRHLLIDTEPSDNLADVPHRSLE